MFGFDYRWEVYKPAAERKYGYYVLPVVYGDRFIGRIEPVLDRSRRELVIRGWWPEPGVEPDRGVIDALERCLAEFASFAGAERIRADNAARTHGLRS